MNPRNFFAELRRRNVYKVAVAYAVVAWLLIQVATQVFPFFDIPNWVVRLIVLAIVVGFPIALVIAWAFELTPEGIKRTEDVDPALATSAKSHAWIYVAVAAAFLSLGLFFLGRFTVSPQQGESADIPAKSIAVLPFDNLSGDKDNAYFANGMQDMILTKLAGIGDLKVISRTSTEKYKSRPDDLKTVAAELGVATILEGSVQKAGNEVLINVQLIDAASDNHLWAEAYTRTLDNIFGVEGEVAQKVADALEARLTPAESAHVAEAPTRNSAAFDVFLQAEEQAQKANASQSQAAYLAADNDYRQAIALDPGFALAYARLAYNQLSRHWFARPLAASELATTRNYVDRALALAPNSPEAHLALGYYYYWGFRQYDEATVQFQEVLQLAPNNSQALEGLAFVARRQGQFPQALSYFEEALRLSPRDFRTLSEYGWTYLLLRRYPEADRQLKLALAMAPADANTMDALLHVRLFGYGDVAGARELSRNPPDWRIAGSNALAGDIFYLVNQRAYTDFFDRKFADALHAWEGAPTDTEEERRTGKVARVVIKLIAGDRESAQADCAPLEPALAAELTKAPDSLGLLQQLSWVEVCLGRRAEAIAAAQRAVALLPISRDAFFGAYQLSGLAQIAAHADAPDQAFEVIRQLLAMPAGTVMSSERLELDPVWDPLRKDPRFQALLKEHAADGKQAAK